jgi:hypothetical protein
MMVVLLIAGIGFVLAGLLGVAFGIPVKEFSFGNTLILTGAVTACTGAIMLALWTVGRELKNIAQQLGPGAATTSRMGTPLPSAVASAAPRDHAPENDGFLFSRDQPSPAHAGDAEPAAQSSAPPPWHEETAARGRLRSDAPPAPVPAEAASAAKPRRNLLFSSSSRRERERAEGRTADPSAAAQPSPKSSEAPPATFEDAWPQMERSRAVDAPPQRRASRTPSTFTETNAGGTGADRHPPTERNEDQPPVTVLKSGVVDGMAYSLYSDGSIEAQMPEGMMRFASIDELRVHLDQRP